MEHNNGREFSVQAVVNGQSQEVLVLTSETTDGVTFYNCRIHGNEITQIRKDDQEWKQIWGQIPEEDVKAIGEAIEGSLLEE
ncbi:hypothetical protein [Niabella ginsengisoli]|uniref:Uncharacterized protein n=1 Tax=Niabella ginsengisoli TaxID=522298 RepID=A0ABS9SM20_9BACT|nr:hypothetical protein [Niabella ginsengisoli]MCH5599412.1 hypothetical protein [Niabella ginsengisoli]